METMDPKILVFLPAFISVIQIDKKEKEKAETWFVPFVISNILLISK